jgi:hypothetical protein
MSFQGQPVPTTSYNTARAKVSDGKSVRVVVPQNTTIVAENFYLINTYFGVAKQSVTTGAGETAEIVLDIEQAEYETDNIVTGESYPIGAALYWDDTAKKFTVTSTSNLLVGRVSSAKDAKNVIWFILGPQV